MRKNLFIAVLTGMALMTACSNNEVDEDLRYSNSNAIEFTALASKQTKALPIDGTSIQNEAIMLKAYKTEEKDYNDFYDKPQAWIDGYLSYQVGGLGSSWHSDHTYYWPSNVKQKLSFFSYAPEKNGETSATPIALIDPIGYDGNVTYPAFEYTVANSISNQKDLIVAAAMNQTQTKSDGTTNTVTLTHKHTLAQVYFKAKANDNNYQFKITSLKVKGAFNKGKFTYDGTADNVGNWSNLTGEATHIYRSSAYEKFFLNATAERVMADDNGNAVLMLLPQPATDKLELEVTYTTYNMSGSVLVKDMVKTAKMEPLLRGKKYVYTLMLSNDTSLKPIEFNVGVSDWEPESSIDIKFEPYTLRESPNYPDDTHSNASFQNNANYIQDMIKAFATEAHTSPFTYTLEATSALKGALSINFDFLNTVTNIPAGSKIILDFNAVTGWDATNKVSIANLPVGWKSSTTSLTSANKLTIIKE